jgi:FlaA1/EpsC-like NDP-sugar epimerase
MTNNSSSFNNVDYQVLKNNLNRFIALSSPISNLAKGYLVITYMNYFFGEKQKDGIDFLFPFKRIKRGSHIIVYGAGNIGKNIVRYLNGTDEYTLVAWVDKNSVGRIVNDIEIQPVPHILDLEYDFIILATNRTMYIEEMRRLLMELKISENKIVSALDCANDIWG